jgi:hypothetical protein
VVVPARSGSTERREKLDSAVQEQVAGVPLVASGQVGFDRFGVLVVKEGGRISREPNDSSPIALVPSPPGLVAAQTEMSE